MTYQEILESNKDFLIPKDVAPVLNCDPYNINVQAKEDPSKLGFPIVIIGTRIRIPRLAFIRWMNYGNAPVITKEVQDHGKSTEQPRHYAS